MKDVNMLTILVLVQLLMIIHANNIWIKYLVNYNKMNVISININVYK